MVIVDPVALEQNIENLEPYHGVKGSIVRLRVQDFMTCHDVEIRAGPNVNLILGPNGTGKSSIVCAICLGLGGKSSLLGRCQGIREYIRRGAETATIETELYGQDKPNVIIKRVITYSEEAGAQWRINGKRSTLREVEEVKKEYNIQLDNLCQFLPQDRVQDFTQMNHIKLLESTQNSVVQGMELRKKHEKLKSLQSEIVELREQINRTTESWRLEVSIGRRSELDVDQYNKREEVTARKNDLEGKKLWIMYMKAMDEFTALDQELSLLKIKKLSAEKTLGPLEVQEPLLHRQIVKHRNEIEAERSGVSEAAEELQNDLEKAKTATKQAVKRNDQVFKAAQNEEQVRKSSLQEKSERLDSLKALRERNTVPGGEWDLDRLEEEQNSEHQKLNQISEEISKLMTLTVSEEFDMRHCEAEKSTLTVQLKALEQVEEARIRYLMRYHPDVARAVRFLFDPTNAEEIRAAGITGKFWKPMILELSVANHAQYGRIAERQIPLNDLIAVFCEDKNDVQRLIHLCKQGHGWHVSFVHHQMPAGFQRPRINIEQYQQYHLYVNLLDLIKTNDYYMSFLVKDSGVFSVKRCPILIGTASTDSCIYEIMENTDLHVYYTETSCVRINKSYYSDNKSAITTYLTRSHIFTSEITNSEKDEITRALEEKERRIAELRASMKEREPAIRDLKVQQAAYQKAIERILSTRVDQETNLNEITTCEVLVNGNLREEKDLSKLRKKMEFANQRARAALLEYMSLTYTSSTAELITRTGELWAKEPVIPVLEKRYENLQKSIEEAKASVIQYTADIRALEPKLKVAAEAAAKLKNEAKEWTSLTEIPATVRKGEVDLDSVVFEIGKCDASLNLLPHIDLKIVVAYHATQKKIKELYETMTSKQRLLDEKVKLVESLKVEWLEPLKELVERISHSFSQFFAQMGCVGEVHLANGDDDNDFTKYGIQIWVKFRSNEPLSELVRRKQSGGERVMSTALYILALQSLTNVPFRVFDEINQGMDVQNETRFFNLLGDATAEGGSTPQYFLLTPKMLPPVYYPENVDFHFILSGPHILNWDEDEEELDKGKAEARGSKSSSSVRQRLVSR